MALNNRVKQGDKDWEKLSLFTENSWKEATDKSITIKGRKTPEEEFSNGHSVIKIEPNFYYYSRERNDLEPIIGVTLRNVSFSIDSEWQEMGVPKFPSIFGIENFVNRVSDITTLGGAGEYGSVWMSKKLWRKSGDLRISPEFRIIDWKGDGRPIKAAKMITKYCLPGQRDTDINKSIKKIESTVKKKLKNTSEDAKQIADWYKKENNGTILASVAEGSKSIVDNANSISTNILDDLHDLFTLKDAPPPVKVQIGQYFYHPDMVIRNVNFEFSKELSVYGPLYVDIQLELVSRKILNGIDDIGIKETKDITSRVEIRSGQSTVQSGERVRGRRQLSLDDNSIISLKDDNGIGGV